MKKISTKISKETQGKLSELFNFVASLRDDTFTETNFVNGAWYKRPDTPLIICFTDVENQFGHGVGTLGIWAESVWGLSELEPASNEEVEAALTKEALKRGYKNGNYKCLSTSGNTEEVSDESLFRFQANQLWQGFPQPSNCVFKNGKWAKVITEGEKVLNLIEEARKRGYGVKGCKVERMENFYYGDSDFTAVGSVISNEESLLFFKDSKGYNVLFYRDGEWATIIKEEEKLMGFQITQEQILEIHKATSNSNQEQLESWFPDAFAPALVKAPVLEVGKWYKDRKNFMFCFNGTFGFHTQYGFNHLGKWSDELGIEECINYTLAEEGEVVEKLFAEAKRRGFEVGARFIDTEGQEQVAKDYLEMYYTFSEGVTALIHGYGNGLIFDQGVWASVGVREKTSNLEKGKWYVFKDRTTNWLMNYQDSNNCYGFNSLGIFSNEYIMEGFSWEEVSREEVKAALLKEAKKRGYKKGNFKCLQGSKSEEFGEFYLDFRYVLYSAPEGCGGRVLFKDGKWAKLKK